MRCPHCTHAPLQPNPTGDLLTCPACHHTYPRHHGIWQLLPPTITHRHIKDREKQGWQNLTTAPLAQLQAHYLQFPYITETPDREFYHQAAQQFDFVLRALGPLTGRHGLDLGGGFGWAAYRLTTHGAHMALADYNDSTPSGLGGAQVYIDQGHHIERYHVDAEALPFPDNHFDFVFSCSFLHHLPRPHLGLHHIARILRPGGRYFAIMEAFCPALTPRHIALRRADHIDTYLSQGINEQVFYASQYQQWFHAAGLRLQVYNTRWDHAHPDTTIHPSTLQCAPGYQPEILTNRTNAPFPIGPLSRLLLRTQLYKIAAHPALFRHLRNPLLRHTQKMRILVGEKAS